MNRKLTAQLSAGLALSLVLAGCGHSPLLGTWRDANENELTFMADGTLGITSVDWDINHRYRQSSGHMAATYKEIDGENLRLEANQGWVRSALVHYTIEGDTLHWREGALPAKTYQRVQE